MRVRANISNTLSHLKVSSYPLLSLNFNNTSFLVN